MKIVKGIINVVTTLIIVIGGIFLILYACGIVPYVVLSGSMEPTIETGSICFINKHADIKKIKENDIIAFKHNNGTLVTHRAVEITDSGIKTKGDNNKNIDGNTVEEENFVGKNIFWIPKVGYVVKKLQSPKGVVMLITCVVLLFVSGLLFGEDGKKSKEKNS